MHSSMFQLFFFLKGGSNSVFSPCSQCVPIMFPMAPMFYPIWFAQSPTPMYINWKGEF
jgi:hypothetical protein